MSAKNLKRVQGELKSNDSFKLTVNSTREKKALISDLLDFIISNLSGDYNPIYEKTALAGGALTSSTTELAVGKNILTVATTADSVKLPTNAETGDTVIVIPDKKYTIYSVTGALICDFGEEVALQPVNDSNNYPLINTYILHSDGKWYYSIFHTEL